MTSAQVKVGTKDNPTVLVFGAGAVGATVGAWLGERYPHVWFYDAPATVDALNAKGITFYEGAKPAERITVKVRAYRDLRQGPKPDIVVLAVKNYSLELVSKLVKDTLGDPYLVIGLQNGVENQSVLPKFFSRVVYGVVSYNAWVDEPGVVGFQKRGPLVFGTLREDCAQLASDAAALFSRGVETVVTDRVRDVVHTKMIINLTNSLTTLVGHRFREISEPKLFQKLLSNLTYEGVKIAKAAGVREFKMSGMPSWRLMGAGARLPLFLTKRAFQKSVAKMVVSSMAQDVLQQRGAGQSELESLNGYFVRLAEKHGVDAPYNRAVYELCRERFAAARFEPMDVREVLARVRGRGAEQPRQP